MTIAFNTAPPGTVTGFAPANAASDLSQHDKRLLTQWNETQRLTSPLHHLLHSYLLDNGQSSDRQAVDAWDGSFTYRELDNASSVLAQHLLHTGSANTVAICLDKSRWIPVTMLAVLKAGAAFVAMDPSLPDQRLLHMLDAVDASCLITANTHASRFDSCSVRLVVDPHLVCAQHHPSLSVRPLRTQPGDKAFIIFTSGSSGRPKGVVHCHGAICTALSAFPTAFGDDGETRFLQFASVAFLPGKTVNLTPSAVDLCVLQASMTCFAPSPSAPQYAFPKRLSDSMTSPVSSIERQSRMLSSRPPSADPWIQMMFRP